MDVFSLDVYSTQQLRRKPGAYPGIFPPKFELRMRRTPHSAHYKSLGRSFLAQNKNKMSCCVAMLQFHDKKRRREHCGNVAEILREHC